MTTAEKIVTIAWFSFFGSIVGLVAAFRLGLH